MASALTRPLQRSRTLEIGLFGLAIALPWLVFAWPSVLASSCAVFLALRSQGRLSRISFFRSPSPDDLIHLVLMVGISVWTITLYFYSTGAP